MVGPFWKASRPMIRYALKCAEGHRFESWFQSAAAYDALAASGHLSCAVCGAAEVTKELMAPRVSASEDKSEKPPERPLSQPASVAEQAMADLRRKIEESSTYVGDTFAAEARAMHEGDAPKRSIHGQAKLGDAKKLIEDGVPVAPLPFLPRRQTN